MCICTLYSLILAMFGWEIKDLIYVSAYLIQAFTMTVLLFQM